MELLAHAKQHLLGLLLVGLVFYVIERVMGARRRPGYFRPGMLTDTAYFFTVAFFKQASRVLFIFPFIVKGVYGWPLAEVAQVVAAGPDELQPLPDTVALIEELKSAGHRLFFLSNMPSPYADLLEDRLPFEQWFEAGVFSSRVKHSKPGEQIYRIASERFGNSSEGYVFLDDQPANISAAIAYGWQGLLFTSAAQARRDIAALVA